MIFDCGLERHSCIVICTYNDHRDDSGIPYLYAREGGRRSILCDRLDEIEPKFTWREDDAASFRVLRNSGIFSVSVYRIADLTPQKLSDIYDAATSRLPRHVSDYGRRLATRHAAEQVFEPEYRVIVEKVKSRHTANGVRLTRRVETFRTKG